jgi:hypothetical protein
VLNRVSTARLKSLFSWTSALRSHCQHHEAHQHFCGLWEQISGQAGCQQAHIARCGWTFKHVMV